MGAWIASASIEDWWLCLLMGVLGYLMKHGGWPRPPIILAIVLGELMEENLFLSTQIYGGWSWTLDKPIVVVIEILIVITLVYTLFDLYKKQKENRTAPQSVSGPDEDLSEGAARNPIISLPLSLLFFLVFCWAYGETQTFEEVETAQFPEAILIVAIPISFITLISDIVQLKNQLVRDQKFSQLLHDSLEKATFWPSIQFIGYILGLFAVTYIAGQQVALPLFVALYLWRWGGYDWKAIALYTALTYFVIWGFYGEIMHLLFHPSYLFG
jgi:preprotein translocase subunit SecG